MVSTIPKNEPAIGKEFPEKVIPLINEAKRSIDIVVFDWRWYPQNPGSPVQLFNQAIVRAVKRGVIVRAISNNNEIHAILEKVGVHTKRIYCKRVMHAKMMIIDGETIIVGSHNYTQNAFQMNQELSVILYEVGAGNRFQTFFNNIYG